MTIYFGDIHNHCGITYGYGGLENALKMAKEQLDFCSVTGHAMWPDIPKRTEKLDFLIDFHEKGFKKLHDNWNKVRNTIKKANIENEFITFQSYEMHSSKYGDHHVLSPNDDLPLIYSKNPSSLYNDLKRYNKIIIPHHIAYTPGYRGINWDYYDEEKSPVIEVFSKHGCSISDKSPYNYYHTMGPRDSRNTIYEGLKRKKQFSFVASSDHHAGYPGSYGDGRIAVNANNKTRLSIFDAIKKGHTYAITGDKIKCHFTVNDAIYGSKIQYTKKRQIYLNVKACDFIEKIVVYKNLIPFKIIYLENFSYTNKNYRKYKIRIEFGWGKSITGYDWNGEISINDGTLSDVETCFRGRNVLAPTKNELINSNINNLNNHILEQSSNHITFVSNTVKNPSPLHPATNSVILEINGNEQTNLSISLNNKLVSYQISELLTGVRSCHIDEYNSEAFTVSCIPDDFYEYNNQWIDYEESTSNDLYHVVIKQLNGQMAWLSPVFLNT